LHNRPKDVQAKSQELDGSFAALWYKNKAGDLVRFTRLSRDSVDDPEIYKRLTQGGASATVEPTTAANGEGAYILKVGDPLSLAMYLEMAVMPKMGYCVKSSVLKIGGVVLSREKYIGFSHMSAGFWLHCGIVVVAKAEM